MRSLILMAMIGGDGETGRERDGQGKQQGGKGWVLQVHLESGPRRGPEFPKCTAERGRESMGPGRDGTSGTGPGWAEPGCAALRSNGVAEVAEIEVSRLYPHLR